jgi:hypothetical protein
LLKNGSPNDRELIAEHLAILKDELLSVVDAIEARKEQLPEKKTEITISMEETCEFFDRLQTLLKERNPQYITLLDPLRAIPGTEGIVKDMENFNFKQAIIKVKRKREELKNTI